MLTNDAANDRMRGLVQALRRLTEFYFQLVTVLILAGLIDVTARAHPEIKKLGFAAQVTVWAVLLWTLLHVMPILHQLFSLKRKLSTAELYMTWFVSALMSLIVAITLIEPFSALASGLVK